VRNATINDDDLVNQWVEQIYHLQNNTLNTHIKYNECDVNATYLSQLFKEQFKMHEICSTVWVFVRTATEHVTLCAICL